MSDGEARKKILVVDDDMVCLEMNSLILSNENYEIITAMDGQEAYAIAQSSSPDLILLDLMLPKMNGYKVCGLLKNNSQYAMIPIILLSASNSPDTEEISKDVGFDAYLKKPVQVDLLLSTIEKLISKN
ncbi:MAG: CheY-like chemotaxis protein [Candidatus Omnitrophota bacterium]|jgi:CheY-like chemotaxis protein